MQFVRYISSTCWRLSKKAFPLKHKHLGRISNTLSVGVVGLANVGKSTFFQAITRSTLGNPANYPFATIEAEKSAIVVESEKLNHFQNVFQSEKKVPTSLTVYDIAGLTRNAASGLGLGNKFLADIRQVDGIFHLVRGFHDDEITHIEHTVDPVRDLIIVTDELILKDLEFIETALANAQKQTKKPGKDKAALALHIATLEKMLETLYSGRKIASVEWSEEEIDIINQLNLLTAKPTVVLLNVNEKDYTLNNNEYIRPVNSWIAENCPQDQFMLFSADFETKLNQLEGEKLSKYLTENDPKPSAMAEIVDAMRKSLHLISFYTCGPKEAHQWSVRKGSTAPEAAGVIHTDLQNTFISAQVYKWDDIKEETGPLDEAALKSKGKQLRVGKTYVVEDGDVLVIKAGKGRK